jgi:predicted GNAT family N-acyltransferase
MFWRSTVRPISGRHELDLIANLRYRVYVQEMGKPYPGADHQNQRILDPLDRVSQILGAFDAEGLLGTVRCTPATHPAVHEVYGQTLSLHKWADVEPRSLAVCSRFVVDRRARGRRFAGLALMCAMYYYGREHGVSVCLCSTVLPLSHFFQRFGFRPYDAPFLESDSARPQARLALLLEDVAHLRAVGSPFLTEATARDRSNPDHRSR